MSLLLWPYRSLWSSITSEFLTCGKAMTLSLVFRLQYVSCGTFSSGKGKNGSHRWRDLFHPCLRCLRIAILIASGGLPRDLNGNQNRFWPHQRDSRTSSQTYLASHPPLNIGRENPPAQQRANIQKRPET